MRRTVIINWGVSSFFGWGVYGLNLALAWANDPDIELACAELLRPEQLSVDPVRLRALQPFLQRSAQLRGQLERFKDDFATAQAPLLASLNGALRLTPVAGNIRLAGTPTIGVTFFETARLSADAVETAARFPLIVAGSSWNEQVLRAHGLTNVRTILQGCDPTLFHPAPRVRFAGDRFLVFSGGKLEPRKGQDIAMAAFSRFAQRHPDAVLVAAWHSPWPQLARGVDASGLAAPVALTPEGKLDSAAWAAANGVRPEQFIDAGPTPNPLMPQLLRQMDVGLFPNRCEGGTNLVAMECMACGVPAILSANSGHLDLIEGDNAFVLTRQEPVKETFAPLPGVDVSGWRESDVDEAVELLERAYSDRDEARRRGERGAETLGRLTWAKTAAEMKAAVSAHAPG